MKRFDDQILQSTNLGDAFQSFVVEALRTKYFESLVRKRHLRSFISRGRDGSIDHLIVNKRESSSSYVVVECKHFGRGRSGGPLADWHQVARTLERNLKECGLASFENCPISYRPWFNVKQPIVGYWFCTSAVMTPGAEDALRSEISGFFRKVSKSISSLSHLKTIEVEVVSWGQFQDALEASPSLDFRWFTQFPRGLKPLQSSIKSESFRSFLNDGSLPFYSRGEFNSQPTIASIPDEFELLEKLLSPEGAQALLISGSGGVGKTRLMMQLAKLAEGEEWFVLQVNRRCKQKDIEQITSKHQQSARILTCSPDCPHS